MYRIAKVSELPKVNFNVNDQVLKVNKERDIVSMKYVPTMQYRTTTYLSSSINVLNESYNSLDNFEKLVKNNYFTDEIEDRYIHKKSLIHNDDISKVMSIGSLGGLLTKEDADNFKQECIALIHQLKEKAMNMFTANLDEIFKFQQSMKSEPIGGFEKDKPVSPKLTNDEEFHTSDYKNKESNQFDFFTGQFSLIHLLTAFSRLSADKDFWLEEIANGMFNFSEYDSLDKIKEKINSLSDNKEDRYGLCNSDKTGKIIIPDQFIDKHSNKTLPVATIVFEVLKRQIYIVMKNIYTEYLVKLTDRQGEI